MLRNLTSAAVLRPLLMLGAVAILMMWSRWGGTIEDSQAYYDTARYLRGELGVDDLRAPFPYRIAVPGLVSLSPFDLRSTFAALNLFCVWMASAVMALTAFKAFASERAAWIAGFLSLVNFCTYWYAPYLLVDPASLLMRSLFVLGVVMGSPGIMASSAIAATTVREENIVLAIWMLLSRQMPVRQSLMLVGACGVWIVFVRWQLIQGLAPYSWTPSLAQLWAALHDTRSLATIFATAAVVAPLALLGWRTAPQLLRPLKSLLLLMAMPSLYALLCVRIDGRAVWGLYPMLIPFAVWALRKPAQGSGTSPYRRCQTPPKTGA